MSVTVVGAGLAGLATAYRLRQAGIAVQVLEANAVAGGRIQPALPDGHQDLGPTWVWPYAQPIITQWLNELQLGLFEQFDAGLGLVDRHANEYAQRHSLPSQYGIARIEGGTHALIVALLDKLADTVKFEHVVNTCTRKDNQWQVEVSPTRRSGNPIRFTSDKLVVAVPPRLAANMLTSNEREKGAELNKAIHILRVTDTWMAPHAKVVVLYESAFWREQGLSGRIASQVGPLSEIHDHSGPDGRPAALFGFAAVAAPVRRDHQAQFVADIKQQLTRCFGEQAPDARQIIIKDWAFEPYTTTVADLRGDGAHPSVLANVVRDSHWNQSLWFAASETSERSPGLIEGALARANDVVREIVSTS